MEEEDEPERGSGELVLGRQHHSHRHEPPASAMAAIIATTVSSLSSWVLATKPSKSDDFIPVADKTVVKKVNESNTLESSKEFKTVMKRMTELEEKVTYMNNQPPTMPPEKEQMLNNAMSRADVLEQELLATKKALEDSLAKQDKLSAYVEKKKTKRKWWI